LSYHLPPLWSRSTPIFSIVAMVLNTIYIMVTKIKKRSRKEKAKLKKLRLNLQFSKASLAETEIIYEECREEYNRQFIVAPSNPNPEEKGAEKIDDTTDISKDVKEEAKKKEGKDAQSNKEEGDKSADIPTDTDIKAIFKKIAVKTHPDKLRDLDEEEVERLTEIYKMAAEASKNKDGGSLLDIAYDLGIEIDIDIEKEVKWIEKKLKKLEGQSLKITQSNAWVWFHSKGKERKKIENFLHKQHGNEGGS